MTTMFGDENGPFLLLSVGAERYASIMKTSSTTQGCLDSASVKKMDSSLPFSKHQLLIAPKLWVEFLGILPDSCWNCARLRPVHFRCRQLLLLWVSVYHAPVLLGKRCSATVLLNLWFLKSLCPSCVVTQMPPLPRVIKLCPQEDVPTSFTAHKASRSRLRPCALAGGRLR